MCRANPRDDSIVEPTQDDGAVRAIMIGVLNANRKLDLIVEFFDIEDDDEEEEEAGG